MHYLRYILAFITPILAWSSLVFCYYAGFSGNIAFYNRFPKYCVLILHLGILSVAIVGVIACIQIYKQKGMNAKTVACIFIPLLINTIIIFLYLHAVLSTLF